MNNTEILKFVIASGILEKYQSNNTCLHRLVTQASKKPDLWESHINIQIAPHTPTSHIGRIYRIRLRTMPEDNSLIDVREAMEQLVGYCKKNPAANITGATFKCPHSSYTVFVGIDKEQRQAICVLRSQGIPPYKRIEAE